MEKILSLLLCVILLTTISGCVTTEKQEGLVSDDEITTKSYEGKKILYIDSYHEGYEWSDGITRGVVETLKDKGVELKIFRMDTKRNTEESFMKQKALEAKSVIEKFNPDVVITSDDNVFKYLVMPYYKDADLPFVFCGLNWDASVYDAPYNNTAGMVEISPTMQIINNLKNYARGDKVSYLAGDVLSARKEAENYRKVFNLSFIEMYAKDFSEWKTMFLGLQDTSDIVILFNNAGIDNWDEKVAKEFVLSSSKIPSGTINEWMMNYSVLGIIKSPEEQGKWSAEAALRILDGEHPSDIPIAKNKRGDLMLNLNVADKLGIIFSTSLIKNAKSIIKE